MVRLIVALYCLGFVQAYAKTGTSHPEVGFGYAPPLGRLVARLAIPSDGAVERVSDGHALRVTAQVEDALFWNMPIIPEIVLLRFENALEFGDLPISLIPITSLGVVCGPSGSDPARRRANL